VAGSNKVLKEGQILFKAGDKSDGMYLIRKGELRVFLEQNGKEVMLASIGAGGMIGEMALFDNSPRSASVKAATECEITQISTEDFAKLMKQIPKWFVSLMAALSGRLRQTNERLQKLEAGGGAAAAAGGAKGKPYQVLLRQLNLLVLLWAKDAVKEGKDHVLPKAPVEKVLIETFGEDAEKVKMMFEVLAKHKVLLTRPDQYKNMAFVAPNRALLNSLPAFIQAFLKTSGGKPCLPEAALNLLRVLERMAQASPYDSLTVAVSDLEKEGARDGLQTGSWRADVDLFKAGFEEVKAVKASNGMGLKTTRKDIGNFVRMHELLAAFYKANLS
jgi:hypothetical protein